MLVVCVLLKPSCVGVSHISIHVHKSLMLPIISTIVMSYIKRLTVFFVGLNSSGFYSCDIHASLRGFVLLYIVLQQILLHICKSVR